MRFGSIVAATLLIAGTAATALAVTTPKIVDTVLHGKRPAAEAGYQESEEGEKSEDGAMPAAGVPTLTVREVIEHLESRGYTEVTEVEREGGRYEVHAVAPDSRRVELYLDARSGEIVGTEDE